MNKIQALTEIIELMDFSGIRAENIHAPEDRYVKDLCESVGYGAVMDSVARQWFLKDPNGAFVVGPCAATVRSLMLGKSTAGEPE